MTKVGPEPLSYIQRKLAWVRNDTGIGVGLAGVQGLIFTLPLIKNRLFSTVI